MGLTKVDADRERATAQGGYDGVPLPADTGSGCP